MCIWLVYMAREHWDKIVYFAMELMHRLKVCCDKCLTASKRMVMKLIVRMNAARGRGDDDDASLLDGLLMGR